MICGTRSGEGRRKQHSQRRQNKPRTICLRRLGASPKPDSNVPALGGARRTILSFILIRAPPTALRVLLQPPASWLLTTRLSRAPPESGNYAVTLTATSGSLSHTTMITVESGSGSAGGVVLPDDKLRLLLDYIPTLSLIPVVLAVGTVGLWRSKRRRENRASFRWLPGP